jgi:hypothetical protein
VLQVDPLAVSDVALHGNERDAHLVADGALVHLVDDVWDSSPVFAPGLIRCCHKDWGEDGAEECALLPGHPCATEDAVCRWSEALPVWPGLFWFRLCGGGPLPEIL